MSAMTGIGRDELARVIAADIPSGSFVNLGIGQPTRIADYLPSGSGVMLHTENGMLGIGFAELSALLGLPLTDGTRAAS